MNVDVEFRTPLGVTVVGGRAIIRLDGDLDLLALRDLVQAVEVLLEQGVHRVDIHLGNVERVDSHATEALASLHERLMSRGGRLGVIGATAWVADALRRRGLAGFLRGDPPDRLQGADPGSAPPHHTDVPMADAG